MTAPLTIERAREIVAFAENAFATGPTIPDAFVPFSEGGAATRFEAVQALYLVIADYFQEARVRDSGSSDAMRRFDRYASLSGPIAWRILCDNVRDPAKVPDALGTCETMESFVAFVKSSSPASADFWPAVYQRIGAHYPKTVAGKIEGCAPSPRKKWWRIWD